MSVAAQFNKLSKPFTGMFADSLGTSNVPPPADSLKPVAYEYQIQGTHGELVRARAQFTYKDPTTLKVEIFDIMSHGSSTYNLTFDPATRTYSAYGPNQKILSFAQCHNNEAIQKLLETHHQARSKVLHYWQLKNPIVTQLATNELIDTSVMFTATIGGRRQGQIDSMPMDIRYSEGANKEVYATARSAELVRCYKIEIDTKGRITATQVDPETKKAPGPDTPTPPVAAIGFVSSNISMEQPLSKADKKQITQDISQRIMRLVARREQMQFEDMEMILDPKIQPKPTAAPVFPAQDPEESPKATDPVASAKQPATLPRFRASKVSKWVSLCERSGDDLLGVVESFYGKMAWYREELKRSPDENATKWLNKLAVYYMTGKKPENEAVLDEYIAAANYFKQLNDTHQAAATSGKI